MGLDSPFVSLPIHSDLCLSSIWYSHWNIYLVLLVVNSWLLMPFIRQLCTMQCALHTNYALSATYLKSLNKSLCDQCDRRCDRILNREWNRDWYRLDIVQFRRIPIEIYNNNKTDGIKKMHNQENKKKIILLFALYSLPYMTYTSHVALSCVHVYSIVRVYINKTNHKCVYWTWMVVIALLNMKSLRIQINQYNWYFIIWMTQTHTQLQTIGNFSIWSAVWHFIYPTFCMRSK